MSIMHDCIFNIRPTTKVEGLLLLLFSSHVDLHLPPSSWASWVMVESSGENCLSGPLAKIISRDKN